MTLRVVEGGEDKPYCGMAGGGGQVEYWSFIPLRILSLCLDSVIDVAMSVATYLSVASPSVSRLLQCSTAVQRQSSQHPPLLNRNRSVNIAFYVRSTRLLLQCSIYMPHPFM